MNKYFLYTIYDLLSEGIEQGYKSGLKEITRKSRSKFTFFTNELLSVNYKGKDIEAINNFKINAFKVAGVGTWELEEALKKLGVEVMENRLQDYNAYEIAVRQKMLEYGIGITDQPPSGWIKQNLDHAIKNSIAGAKWIRATDPQLKGLYTHWIYKTQRDERVREKHQELEGTCFEISDPSASVIFPPNDWGCRCYDEFITGAESKNLLVASREKSKELLKTVPADFRFNPGINQDIWGKWLNEKLHGMPEAEYIKLRRLLKNEFTRA